MKCRFLTALFLFGSVGFEVLRFKKQQLLFF